MSFIEITHNSDEVLEALNRLVHRVDNPTPAMQRIAGVLEEATESAFATESDPATGVAWDPLSEVTLTLRPYRQGGALLQDSGRLRGSISTDYGQDFAQIGTNVPYATTHQFGAQKGEFGRFSLVSTRQVISIPWGDIPARPFLGIGPEDERDILQIAAEHLAGAFE